MKTKIIQMTFNSPKTNADDSYGNIKPFIFFAPLKQKNAIPIYTFI